jgi:hypothetical protein
MTHNDGFDRTVSGWLHEQAGRGAPGYLDEVLVRTTRTRQRPAWSSLERWLPMVLTAHPRFVARLPLGRALLVGAVLLALIGIAIIAVGSRVPRVPAPFGLATNGQIAYWADGDISAADPDGTHVHPIVAGPTEDFAPLYSRDGTRVAFWRAATAHESMLMVAAPDGSAVRPVLPEVLTDADWFEWSPDSRSLAVVHTANDTRVLSIVDVDRGTIRMLDVGGLVVDNSVYWRPGTKSELIFTSHAGSGDSMQAGIYSIQAEGGPPTAIAPSVTGGAEYLNLDLAPDGRTLTYWRWQELKGSHIHRLDIATGVDRELRFDPSATGETGLLHSPDGTLVLIQREDTVGQVMIAPADASRAGILVGLRFDLNADPWYGFSPDGQTVFVGFAGEQPQFFDVTTGASRTGPATPSECCTWQRLAP